MIVSRSVRRLLLIIALCMIVILLSKSLLGKAVKNLSIAAEKKQHASSKRISLAVPAPAVSAAVEMPSSAAAADSSGIQTEASAVAADNISAGH
jgi:hypothetical protein